MEPGVAQNWRDGGAYAALLAADRSMFAWEWLRRRADYQEAARGCAGSGRGARAHECSPARPWGLHRFEPPEAAIPAARPIWREEVYPAVLKAGASPCRLGPDAFELADLGVLVTLNRERDGAEHLLLSDGLRALRVDIVKGSVGDGPVLLHFDLRGMASAQPPLLTLRRLLALSRRRRFAVALHPRESRARRWILMLRAYDALQGGAPQREIAATLFGGAARNGRWRVEVPSLRLQAQRLVRSARAMADGGYIRLLGP